MLPEEVLASNPAILEKAKELSKRRVCRFCLSEVDTLVDIDAAWKMKIVSCFPLVTVGCDKLPKFICLPCRSFVKKCFEFRQLCKKSEQMLVSYPLTGTWAGELVIPRWLRVEEHLQLGKKRKVVDELEVPQVGSVRVRSHESMAMSLQSPTITPGSVEQSMVVDEQLSRQEVIDSHPTVIQQLNQPTITPTAHQPTFAIPVIQSQLASSQYPPSTLPYNSPSQFSNRTANNTPVIQPVQTIQRTNSVQKVSPLLPFPGYIMQQNTAQLVGHSQLQSCNTNLNNMTNMVAQLPSYPQPQQQQQHQVQVSISNVSLNSVGAMVNQLQRPTNYGQSPFPSTFINHQQPPIPMTPTRYQNYQQSPSHMTPTRGHSYYQPPPPQQQQQQPPPPSKPANVWCHVCSFKFLTVDHYQFHIRKHSTSPLGNLTGRLAGRLRTCRLCTAPMFATQADLVQHLKAHEQVGLTKACDFCAKIFADEERRNEHYSKDHAEELRRTLRLNKHLASSDQSEGTR